MTIWTFGDSYAEKYDKLDNQWMTLVSEQTHRRLMAFGVAGSSLGYTYNVFNKVKNKIRKNDIVIFVPTELNRKWLFKDRINDGPLTRAIEIGTKEEKNAAKQYILHLENLEAEEDAFINFLFHLQYETDNKNLHTIILKSFSSTTAIIDKLTIPRIHVSDGALNDNVQHKEFTPEFLKIVEHKNIHDCRVNHLCKRNHTILANKILDNIKYKKPINLYKGFFESIISADTKTDLEFCNTEFFGNKWTFN